MIKLVYAEMEKQSIITSDEAHQVPATDVPQESKGTCALNNVAYFTALWFGYDAPPRPKGMSTFCEINNLFEMFLIIL